jgi:hypothetical protein
MRASSGQPPSSIPLHCSGAPSPALAIGVVEPLKDLNDAVGHSVIDDLAIHYAQLHPDLRFDIGSECIDIFFGSLAAHGSYSWRWLVLVHLLFRAWSHQKEKLTVWVLVPAPSFTRLRVIPALRSHASELFEAG